MKSGEKKQPPETGQPLSRLLSAKVPLGEKITILREVSMSPFTASFRLVQLQQLLSEHQRKFSEGKCTASELRTEIDLMIALLKEMKHQDKAQYAVLASKDGGTGHRVLDEISEFSRKNLETSIKGADVMIGMYRELKDSLKEKG